LALVILLTTINTYIGGFHRHRKFDGSSIILQYNHVMFGAIDRSCKDRDGADDVVGGETIALDKQCTVVSSF